MSKIEVDTIDTVTGTSTLTIGDTNTSTIAFKSGATITGISSYEDSDALSLFNATGSAPVYACRAWVNFNGTGTVAIRESGNVTSITDNGTGDYTVNFTTAMPDGNQAITGMKNNQVSNNGSHLKIAGYNASTVQVQSFENNSITDCSTVCVAIFR